MLDETPKKFDRIVAILIQLQSKKIVKAHELAERFEVSLRTIYRDIRTLEASGVPIYSEAGIGYSLMDGYRLPPVMFTREEASSFIAAEKLMQKFTDAELGNHYASAMYKLKAVLQGSDKDWVSTIESKVLMQTSGKTINEKAPNALAFLFKSIAERTQIILGYEAIDADGMTERTIEPVGVFHDHNSWYFLGYCHLRKDYRQFKTDRIHSIKNTAVPFVLEHEPLEVHLQKEKQQLPATRIVIRVDKKIAKYIAEGRKHHGFVSEKKIGDEIEMTFMCQNVSEYFPRWYLSFGDYASIVEPEELKSRILELIERAKIGLMPKD